MINSKNKNSGFTLIELLVVLSLFLIIIVLTITSFRFFEIKSVLNKTAKEIISTLELARSRTLASDGDSRWGVYFEQDNFVLFKGNEYNPELSDKEINNISERLEIYDIDLFEGSSEIIFTRLIGETNNFGKIGLRVKNSNPEQSKIIHIENSGSIFLNELELPNDENLIVDSRHLHFNFGWSIQDATFLKFDFINSFQVEIVNMDEFFNFDKSSFYWDNEDSPFIVNGNNQIFKVHTHFLNESDTILCIHRERDFDMNNQEVIIYIADGSTEKEIIHYFADSEDSFEKGFYVDSFEIQ